MKKALLAVALVMATITGWCESMEWSEMYGLPTSQDWDTMILYGFRDLNSTDIEEIDAAIIEGAEESDYSPYDFIYNSSRVSDLNYGIYIDDLKRELFSLDDVGLFNYLFDEGVASDGTTMIFATFKEEDCIVKEYLFVRGDGNGNYEPNTWKSFQAVPEPASGLLIVMGSVLLAFRRKVA